jgi:limonene-1,2-epoxide hydrolase
MGVPQSKRMTRRSVMGATGLAMAAFLGRNLAAAQAKPLTAEEQANVKVIADFIAAWNARDTNKVLSFLSPDARFSAGRIGKFAPLRPPAQMFSDFIARTKTVKMTVKPDSTRAVGPMVIHERVDQMSLVDGTTNGSGTFFAVFGLQGGKIVDFIDFQID